LRLDDFQKVDGLWVIDINAKKEKKLKTKSSVRMIPIHPFLLTSLKLVRYVESLRSQGHIRLSPELKNRREGYGMIVSRWFARYKERCGVESGTF
jgi:hypothetical protein